LNADTRYGKSPYGRSRWKMTVCSSTFSTLPLESTPAKADSAAEPTLGSVMRSNEATTSSTVNGVPSCHLTPWRIVNVQESGVEPATHLVARRGWSTYFASGKTR
jgi:hypothetical protein